MAGAEAEAATVAEVGLLGPLIAIGVAAVVATAPITVLATTFGLLAGGIVGLPLLMGFLGDEVNDLMNDLRIMAQTIATAALPMAQQFLAMLTPLIPTITELGLELVQWFADRLPTMLPIFTQIVTILVGAVFGLAQAWGHLVDWFMANWPLYSASLKSLFDQIGTGIHFVTPLLGLMGAMFQALGPVIQFVRDHADSLKPILYAVGALLVVVAASAALTVAALLLLVAAITAIAAALSAAVNWVKDAVEWLGYLIDKAGGAANAVRGLASAISGLPGVGGVLGGVLDRLTGGRASGGPVFPGGVYTVGEDGPETLVMGAGGGFVVPGRGAGGGATTYNLNVTVSPLANPAEVGRQIVQAIQEYERRGSMSWRQ